MRRCHFPRVCAVVFACACAGVLHADDFKRSTPEKPRRLPSVFASVAASAGAESAETPAPTTTPPAIPYPTTKPQEPVVVTPTPVDHSRIAKTLEDFAAAKAAAQLGQPTINRTAAQYVQPSVTVKQKPFQQVNFGPTVSPYINLYREDLDDTGVPNYYMFVRPQFEQLRINRTQERGLNRVQQQVRTLQYEQPVREEANVMPATGHRTRFFNTAGYYAQPKTSNRR